jgi:hypothetical protein
MNKTIATLLPAALIMLLTVLLSAMAHADVEDDLAESSLHLDYKADKTGWPSAVFDQIRNEFDVSEDRIYSLRGKGLTYGEISTVLSLAEQMPGGITDKNIAKILVMRQGSGYQIGWGSIAKALQVQVSSAVRHAHAINESPWTTKTTALPREDVAKNDKHDMLHDSRVSAHLQGMPGLEDGMKPGH